MYACEGGFFPHSRHPSRSPFSSNSHPITIKLDHFIMKFLLLPFLSAMLMTVVAQDVGRPGTSRGSVFIGCFPNEPTASTRTSETTLTACGVSPVGLSCSLTPRSFRLTIPRPGVPNWVTPLPTSRPVLPLAAAARGLCDPPRCNQATTGIAQTTAGPTNAPVQPLRGTEGSNVDPLQRLDWQPRHTLRPPVLADLDSVNCSVRARGSRTCGRT